MSSNANLEARRARGPFAAMLSAAPSLALAQGFDKINTTVTNVNEILITISIAVVTIAIIWAGFKMIFQGARLSFAPECRWRRGPTHACRISDADGKSGELVGTIAAAR